MWDEVRDCPVQTQEQARFGAGGKKETQEMMPEQGLEQTAT